MELILLVIGAGVVGYFLAGSKFSERINQATDRTTDMAKNAAGQVGNFWNRQFNKQQASGEVVDAEFVEAESEEEAEDKRPAEKQPSRRKSAEE